MHVFQDEYMTLEIFFVWPFKAQKALLDSIRLIMHEWLDDGSSTENTYANLSLQIKKKKWWKLTRQDEIF